MDNRAISDSGAHEMAIESVISRMFFIRPGVIKAWHPEKNMVDAVVGIKAKKSLVDGKVDYEDLPLIPNVPIAVPYSPAAGLGTTFPIRVGDPCTLLFSDRMINLFLKEGKVCLPEENGQDNQTTEPRQHEIEDAICFPGVILRNSVFSEWNNDAVETRDLERKVYTSVSRTGITSTDGEAVATVSEGKITCTGPKGVINTDGTASVAIQDGHVHIAAPNGITIDSPNFWIGDDGYGWVTGDFRARNLEALQTVNGSEVTTGAGFSANSHLHSGVEPGGGNTGRFV